MAGLSPLFTLILSTTASSVPLFVTVMSYVIESPGWVRPTLKFAVVAVYDGSVLLTASPTTSFETILVISTLHVESILALPLIVNSWASNSYPHCHYTYQHT